MLKRTKLCTSLMIAFGGGIAAMPAMAQQTLERVEITGSSIKRIDAETALPVQVITREQIQKSGVSNVEQLLQTISAVSSSQGLTAASASGATTGGISAVSLRGLGSQRTLVLLNGRRIAPYGLGFTNDSVSVDVNSIPLSAIERVEVLKDGASAIYGSDAIAGVINFILRQEVKGIELAAEYGDTTQGGANFKRVTGTAGFGDLASDRFNVMIVGSYQKEGKLFGRQRDFAKTDIREYEGQDTTSGNTFPGNIVTYDPVTGAAGRRTRNPSTGTGQPPFILTGCPAPYSGADPLLAPNMDRCRFDPAGLVALVPESDRLSVFASGKFAITPDIQAYVEGSYNKNKLHTVIQPVPLSDQFAIPSNNPLCQQAPYNNTSSGPCQSAIWLKPTSPFYPTAYSLAQYGPDPVTGLPRDLLVRYRSAMTGNRDLTDISEAPRLTGGVKGTAIGWDFDANVLYTESKVREQVNGGYPSLSQILPLLNSGNVNLFGPNSQAIQDQALATNFKGDAFKVKSSLTSVSGKGSRDIFQLPAGPLGFAIGFEGRKEKYNFSADPTIQTGDISGYGGNFFDLNKTRNVTAVFSEVSVPIVKNLEADFAVRYDHYQGVGNSTTPKGSLRWQPTPQVLVRTSYGQGFRAPSLQDLYAQNTQSVSPAGLNDPLRCVGANIGNPLDCATQFTVTFGGNQALQPEKSHNFTLGTVLEPVNNLSIGIDYWRIRVNNQITNGLDAATILSDPVKYAALITRAAPDAANPGLPGHITNLNETNLNLGISRLSGLDFDVKWRLPAGDWGKFTLGGSATYFIKYDGSNLDGTYSGGVDLPNQSTGGLIPRFRSYLSVDWTLGPWNVNAAQTWQKGYHDVASNVTGVDRDVRPYISYDLQGTYEMSKSWRFTLGVKNLFDSDPPYVNSAASFQAGYDPQYADPRGRFIYGRVTYAYR